MSCNSYHSYNTDNSCKNQGGCHCCQPHPPCPPTCDNPSITIGTTTTGMAGSQAMVTNSGTSCNAVLNFTIPQGQPGTPGQAATITVGTTTTGEAGTNAIVTNTGTAQNAVLNFTIPRGTAGSNMPAGLAAYGGLYNGSTQTLNITAANQYEQISLDSSMPLSNMTTGANGITVTQEGDYEISYSVSATGNRSVTMTVSIRNNGIVIPSTSSTQALGLQTTGSTNYSANYVSQAIVHLTAGSVIDLAILSATVPEGLSVTMGVNGDATMMLKKLDA
ncbi:MAG: hypothetical protein KHZ62_11135 [Clostridiales bacterium]|nr:hypothetical protein [Clostridiales bacterium]